MAVEVRPLQNDYVPERLDTTAVGDVAVEVLRIRALDGARLNFATPALARYAKSFLRFDASAYRKEISERDVSSASDLVLGSEPKWHTPAVPGARRKSWTPECTSGQRTVSKTRVTSLVSDGIYHEIRGDEHTDSLVVVTYSVFR